MGGASSTELCYLCGEREADTRDHIFPSQLFLPPRPDALITAPACSECNGSLSLDEDYFSAFASAASYGSEVGHEMWDSRTLPRLRRPEARGFRNLVASSVGSADVATTAGLYLGSIPTLQGDRDRMNRVLEKMVRGLHYHHLQSRVSNATRFNFYFLSAPDQAPLPSVVGDAIAEFPKFEIGNEVLYRFGQVSEDDLRYSLALLAFYQRAFFVAVTSPLVSA